MSGAVLLSGRFHRSSVGRGRTETAIQENLNKKEEENLVEASRCRSSELSDPVRLAPVTPLSLHRATGPQHSDGVAPDSAEGGKGL